MGSAQDIMQAFVSKDFHARFPAYDGWKLESVPNSKPGSQVYRASRYYRGQPQTAILTVSFDPKPSAASIEILNLATINSRTKISRYLLVPQGADISGVPATIGLLTMKSFGFSDGELVWLTKKKNAALTPKWECLRQNGRIE